eukprot:5369589-Pleurochrysis_carterae.AAC.2
MSASQAAPIAGACTKSAIIKSMSCNMTCYKRDTCNTIKWHRAAIFGAPAKAMTNIGSKFKVADMFPSH